MATNNRIPSGPRNLGAGIGGATARKASSSCSSASDEGGLPIHDEGSAVDYFEGDPSTNEVAPAPMTSAFEKLKIENQTPPHSNRGRGYRRNTYTGGNQADNDDDFEEDEYNSPGKYRVPFRRGPRYSHSHRSASYGNSRGRGGGNFRTSSTWVSPETQQMTDFLIVRNSMRRLFKNSEVAKWKLADYIAHREAMLASEAAILANRVKMQEEGSGFQPVVITPDDLVDLKRCLPGNFTMEGNLGRVLGEKTIWCLDWKNGKDEIAPWPTPSELKWEGDDRAKTGCGRFLPLPREQNPPGIMWNQLQVVDQYPIDEVAKIPTMEDIYLPVDEIGDEVKHDLVNEDLEIAMDEYLES